MKETTIGTLLGLLGTIIIILGIWTGSILIHNLPLAYGVPSFFTGAIIVLIGIIIAFYGGNLIEL